MKLDRTDAISPSMLYLKNISELTIYDLPWISVSERSPNYTYEQFIDCETQCLIKSFHDGIEMAWYSPNERRFYDSMYNSGNKYPLYHVEEWFPISPEAKNERNH